MTRPDVDPELRSFMETYERLLVLTDTASVSPSLQPQFVARLLRGRPGELIAIQELYDRIRDGAEPAGALLEDVRPRMGPLTSLLRSAEALEAPAHDQPARPVDAGPATPIAPTESGPATPSETGAPDEYAAFVADHGRLTDIARRVGRGSVDRGLRGLGARPADIVALRLLTDRLRDPTVEPEDVADEIRDGRRLLDELLARAGDGQPDHPLMPSPADRAACDDYLRLYDELVAAGGATRTAGHAVDAAATADLADRIRQQQAPTRVLAIEAERSRPTIEALLAELAETTEPVAAGRAPRRFVPDSSARAEGGVEGGVDLVPPSGPPPPRRFTPLPAVERAPASPVAPEAIRAEKPALAAPAVDDAALVTPVILPPPPRRRVFDVRRLLILVIVLAVLDLAALSWWYFSRDDSDAESVAAVAAAGPVEDEPTATTAAVSTTAVPPTTAPTTAAPTTAPARPSTTAPPATTAAPATTAPTTTTTVLPEVASGDQCHLVPIISYPSLDGAVGFIEQGDGVRTDLPRNLRAYPSAEVPGYGRVGYLVAAVGATPEEAQQLAGEAAASGFTTRAITLPNPCPVATLAG